MLLATVVVEALLGGSEVGQLMYTAFSVVPLQALSPTNHGSAHHGLTVSAPVGTLCLNLAVLESEPV